MESGPMECCTSFLAPVPFQKVNLAPSSSLFSYLTSLKYKGSRGQLWGYNYYLEKASVIK
jgi:hypothetical protein